MLHIHRAQRADGLVLGLAGVLSEPLTDPLLAELVAVPTRGVERWVTQTLSARLGTSSGRTDGVCANVDFPFPSRLVGDVLALATGVDPEQDPWRAERVVWTLLEVIDDHLHEPWLATLASHLHGVQSGGAAPGGDAAPTEPGGASRLRRRFGVIRHVAGLFDRYAIARPEMVRGWAQGAELRDPAFAWQPELWRRLRERIGIPGPAERLPAACQRIREAPDALELPPRLSLFGLTRLPPAHLDVLAALAEHRHLHLFSLHPSPALWERVGAELRATGGLPVRRREDRTSRLPVNRLLASWGRDARELQLVLAAARGATEHHHPLPPSPATLLTRIQADIQSDRQPPGAPAPGQPDGRPLLDPEDRSIQIHACHGRARQVEVLRDAILHLLADDPTLEPRDLIVMCPDIDAFAPLIQATFGSRPSAQDESREDPVDLRVRLADRALRQTNPILSAVARLLELADGRLTASQLLDLADRSPARRRFGLGDDDLSRMREWVIESGIRWGIDAEHRRPFRLEAVAANTWRAGLDRILLGAAVSEDDRRLVGGVLPLDDVESGAIELAGRFAEYVDRVQDAAARLTRPQALPEWVAAIAHAADTLFTTSERESWQRDELDRLLAAVLEEAARGSEGERADGATSPRLELADIRALLADRLQGRPTRANFRTGHLTVCTLVPMRSVPHRVVCLLGLDDGEFPRHRGRDGDDLTLVDPHVGDRDARAEDRQMLLDALLAARERLIITFTGNDVRSNLPRPPAVPVAELLDAVEQTVRVESGSARNQVLVRHPLQPFDPRNFTPWRPGDPSPWSFDRVSLQGARSLRGRRTPPPRFLSGPLPPLTGEVLELAALVRFLEHPVRAFLRDRLGISAGRSPEEISDALPVELDALEQWGVGQRMLEGILLGNTPRECALAEVARGVLPPGILANPVLRQIGPRAVSIANAAREHAPGEPTSLDVNTELRDGRTLSGTVSGVCGDLVRSVSYSRVRPRERLRAWARLMALTAAQPDVAWASFVIGRARPGLPRAEVTIGRLLAPDLPAQARRQFALTQLERLVQLYDRGMREPLPLACEASAAYARAASDGEDARAAARGAWKSPFGQDREDRDPEHVLVWGGELDLDQLLEEPPAPEEAGPGWLEEEATRFGRLARRLWDPVLAGEEFSDR